MLPRRRGRDEDGASLILALTFLTVVSATALWLTTWSTNALNVVAKFASPQLTRSAANSAAEVAVQSERYVVTPSSITPTTATPPAICSDIPIPNNGLTYNFTVWCDTVIDLGSSATRVVSFEACAGTPTSSVCSNPYLTVTVTYDDYSFPISQVLTSYCKENCGTAETISSWIVIG